MVFPSLRKILFWIFLIILGSFASRINRKLKNILDNIIDGLLDKLSFKITLYKKKTRDFKFQIDTLFEKDKRFMEPQPNLIFESRNTKNLIEWNIIKVDKTLDKNRIEKSVILQLPKSSKFNIERNLMSLNYKNALFYSISKILAEKNKKFDLMSEIDDLVEKQGL